MMLWLVLGILVLHLKQQCKRAYIIVITVATKRNARGKATKITEVKSINSLEELLAL